jgi:hypothetical protein
VKQRARLLRVAGMLAVAGAVAFVALHSSRPAPAAAPLADAKRVRGLVCARPFKLDTGYASAWRAERPLVSCGWLLVLDVDPALVEPRDELERVLYVGDQTAERINQGNLAARCVVVVPSAPDAQGWPASDLAAQPMWFGAEALPEQIDAAALQTALADAASAGIAPFTHTEVVAALACGGPGMQLVDRSQLLIDAARWIVEYAPQERDFAHGMLAQPPH